MIDKGVLARDIQSLADLVVRWDKQASERLMHLRGALMQREYEQAWAASDIYQLINPDVIIERYRGQDTSAGCLVAGLELLRNTLIFAPIFVTWLGVSQASSNYHDLLATCLKTCPDQVSQPFLYLWEQGFGGRLPDFLRLSSIGLIDASILFTIFILTWIVSLLASARNRAQERMALNLHGDLVNVIEQASLCLRDKPARPTPLASPSQSLDDVALQIENIANKTLNRFGDVADKIDDKFDTLTQRMEAHFLEATNKFKSVAQDLSTHFKDIEEGLTKQLQESGKQLDAMTRTAASVMKVSEEIRKASEALENANRTLGGNLAQVINSVKALGGSMDDAMKYLEGAAKKIDDMSDIEKKWGSKFLDSMDTLDALTNKIESLINSIGDFNKDQQSFLTQLEQRGDNLAGAVEGLNDATWAIQDALDAFNEGSNDIRSIAVDLSDIKRFTAALTDNSSLHAVVEDYTRAADVIMHSGDVLSDATDGLFEVVKDLKDVTSKLRSRLTS